MKWLQAIQSHFQQDTLPVSEQPSALPDGERAALLKKVRQIEIKTKGLSNHMFSGEYHSVFKGRGMSFSEVREYSYGDDVRGIDWNVTARFNSPFIKVYEEERELTLLLMVDISASSLFGTQKKDKRELITEICAVLAFSAISNNDKVGVLFFSDKVERYIPPKKGRTHILFIIRELLSLQPHTNAKTNIEAALKFLNSVVKRRSILFLLSDFHSNSFSEGLNLAAKKHDLIGVHVYDRRDYELPPIGLVTVQDLESNETRLVDTSDPAFQRAYRSQFEKHSSQTAQIFARSGSELLRMETNGDYVKKLQLFFKSRM
jgi:uncharacterized protein (DUF58 family)